MWWWRLEWVEKSPRLHTGHFNVCTFKSSFLFSFANSMCDKLCKWLQLQAYECAYSHCTKRGSPGTMHVLPRIKWRSLGRKLNFALKRRETNLIMGNDEWCRSESNHGSRISVAVASHSFGVQYSSSLFSMARSWIWSKHIVMAVIRLRGFRFCCSLCLSSEEIRSVLNNKRETWH